MGVLSARHQKLVYKPQSRMDGNDREDGSASGEVQYGECYSTVHSAVTGATDNILMVYWSRPKYVMTLDPISFLFSAGDDIVVMAREVVVH